MANRNFSPLSGTLEKQVITLYATVAIGGTGAPTLRSVTADGKTLANAGTGGFRGIKSIARNSAGQYKVVLQDTYYRLLACWVGFQVDAAPAAPTTHTMSTGTDVTSASSPQITVQCRSSAGAATDPASGEVMVLEIELANSGAL